jgi:NAD(P)-dependent dehydrogenase (short-subunit alcohol dehydrogenase family)
MNRSGGTVHHDGQSASQKPIRHAEPQNPADEFGFDRTSQLLNFSGELAMPEDLADAILFLASDQSRYVNGEEIKCDGGWTSF